MKRTKLIQGVGINDADYPICKKENGKIVWTCPYYQTWTGMLKRGCNDKVKQKYPTYEGVTVCEEWHSFTNFSSWMMEQDWQGKHLDKDILVLGNKVYSPTTCVFVDKVVNLFLTDSAASRGKWPIGASWDWQKQKFKSCCSNPFTKKQEYLGYFHCPNQAHLAWKKRKHELACQLADLQSDERVAAALKLRYS